MKALIAIQVSGAFNIPNAYYGNKIVIPQIESTQMVSEHYKVILCATATDIDIMQSCYIQ